MANGNTYWAEDTYEYEYEYTTCEELKEELSKEGKVIGEVRVDNGGFKRCYLGTHYMDVRFQSPTETVVDGNLSLRWVIQHADGGEQEGAHLISNAVTDEANEMRKIGVVKTYLEVKNRVSFKEYNVEVEGSGSPFYFREDKVKKCWAIYTLLDKKTEAYLQPASDDKEYRLTVMVGPPKYIFKFHKIKKSVQLPV